MIGESLMIQDRLDFKTIMVMRNVFSSISLAYGGLCSPSPKKRDTNLTPKFSPTDRSIFPTSRPRLSMSSIGPRSSTPYNGHVSQKIDPLGQRKVLGVNGLAPRETSGRSFEQRPTKACLTDRLIGGLDEREKSFNKQFSLASRIY